MTDDGERAQDVEPLARADGRHLVVTGERREHGAGEAAVADRSCGQDAVECGEALRERRVRAKARSRRRRCARCSAPSSSSGDRRPRNGSRRPVAAPAQKRSE
jgi:hypothetical protein